MPDPSPVESIFFAALERPDPADRAAYLDAACAGDADVRARVDRLLAAHPRAAGFLEQPPAAVTHDFAPTGDHDPAAGPADAPGAVLAGRYKLLEPIGEGGMGTVWMAQQTEPVRRLVAVKLIKAGMDSKGVLARFEAERQALALMDHPNIAKVLDAGAAPDGRPFFVMELVRGVPITQFCDAHTLTPRQRLELFIPVCQAVQHAHQKGVIHRDLKPTNVLVALYDGRPVPKVIDFGVAKAAGQPLTDHTLVTGFGAVVGTPEYMSPEQASFNQLDVDTRSDVYALGVLLYELLAGSPPFSRKELAAAGVLEVLRVVREQEPPKPSTRLSTAAALPSLAAVRGTEPAKLARLVRGDLDRIVMKALEKDRDRRYETATGLAADVGRYLAGEPVQAVPPSRGYRLRKFVRRNRGPVLAASLVLLALVAGVAGTGWGYVRALRASEAEAAAREEEVARRREAEEQRQKAEASAKRAEDQQRAADAQRRRAEDLQRRAEGERRRADASAREAKAAAEDAKGALQFLGELLQAGRNQSRMGQGDVTVRQALSEADKSAARLRDKPLVEAAVRNEIGLFYNFVRDRDQAVRHLERALAIREAKLGANHNDTVETMFYLGMANFTEEHITRAVPLFERALALRRTNPRADPVVFNPTLSRFEPSDPAESTRVTTSLILQSLAGAYKVSGRPADAVPIYRELIALMRQRTSPANKLTLPTHLRELGRCLVLLRRNDEAELALRESLTLYEAQPSPSISPIRFEAMSLLGGCLLDRGKYAEAESLLTRAYEGWRQSNVRPLQAEVVDRLVQLYETTGRMDEAAKWRARRPPEFAPPPRPAKP